MHKLSLGRHVLGVAAIFLGVITLVWHDFNGWQQIDALGQGPQRAILAEIVGAIEIVAGLAVQWPRTTRAGAIALAGVFSFFALLWIPRIMATPLVYDPWGNFFEESSQVAGALMVYATVGRARADWKPGLARFAYFLFAICVVSFMLEQLLSLSATASFVPKWIPPGQMFWAILTTIAFGLAALALFAGRQARLAASLTTAMIIGFGLLVWLPTLFANTHQLFNWAGNGVNLAIAGAAWVVADSLGPMDAG